MTPIIYDDIPSSPLPGDGRVIGIGVFDGVHRGHQIVIRKVLEEARAQGLPSLLFTFDRLPEEILRPQAAPKRLMSLDEKLQALSALGPDEILVAHVRPQLLATEAEAFVQEILCRLLKPRTVVIGQDFRFGRGGKGSAQSLQANADTYGFDAVIVPPVRYEGDIVSSTRIRGFLAEGEVTRAAEWLTRPFRLTGEVVHGQKLGRTLGFPTANLAFSEHRMTPGNGIYACRARIEGIERDAAVSIGVRPTIGEKLARTVEAYLLDFDGDLYGKTLSLDFIERIRDELRFNSLDALKVQIAEDVRSVRLALERPNQK